MKSLSTELVASLISDIYDCAIEPALWPAALARVADTLQASYVAINLSSLPYQEAVLAAHSPWDIEALKVLNQEFSTEIPGLPELAYGALDTPRSSLDSMDEAQFQTSRFYREWVAPQGLRDSSMCKIAQTGDRIGIAVAVTAASRAVVSPQEHQLMQLLSPHFRRAVMIGDLLNTQRLAASSYGRLIDSLSSAIVLTDKYGKVHQLNAAAQAILEQDSAISVVNGYLQAATAMTTGLAGQAAYFKSLAVAIERAAQGDTPLGQRGIGLAMHLPGKSPIVAYVLPLQVSDARSAFNPAAVALFLSTRELSLPVLDSTLATLFELTPAEIRVLNRMTKGLCTQEIASELSVSNHTIVTHMKHLYEKTGTNKQTQLMALNAALAPPITAD